MDTEWCEKKACSRQRFSQKALHNRKISQFLTKSHRKHFPKNTKRMRVYGEEQRPTNNKNNTKKILFHSKQWKPIPLCKLFFGGLLYILRRSIFFSFSLNSVKVRVDKHISICSPPLFHPYLLRPPPISSCLHYGEHIHRKSFHQNLHCVTKTLSKPHQIHTAQKIDFNFCGRKWPRPPGLWFPIYLNDTSCPHSSSLSTVFRSVMCLRCCCIVAFFHMGIMLSIIGKMLYYKIEFIIRAGIRFLVG